MKFLVWYGIFLLAVVSNCFARPGGHRSNRGKARRGMRAAYSTCVENGACLSGEGADKIDVTPDCIAYVQHCQDEDTVCPSSSFAEHDCAATVGEIFNNCKSCILKNARPK